LSILHTTKIILLDLKRVKVAKFCSHNVPLYFQCENMKYSEKKQYFFAKQIPKKKVGKKNQKLPPHLFLIFCPELI